MRDPLDLYYLQQMGINPWILRKNSIDKQLEHLVKKVASCTSCTLHKTRSQTVFARGNAKAKLMIIGEAPGYYEDKQGLPFVGKAGFLLNKMLKSIELSEQDIYIANVLKCRPPNNRDPLQEEIASCQGFLMQQIDIVQPNLILALGRFAGQFLLGNGNRSSLKNLRERMHQYQNIPFIVTYHPAYLLRNPADKKHAFSDLTQVKRQLQYDR